METAEDNTAETDQSPVDARIHLIEFLRARDVLCPGCGYNLRNLRNTTCPECHELLELRVGIPRIRLLWLMLTIAPGCAGGALALVFIALSIVFEALPPEIIGFTVFCAISALVAFGVGMGARGFTQIPRWQQIVWAVSSWFFHGLFLTLFILNLL